MLHKCALRYSHRFFTGTRPEPAASSLFSHSLFIRKHFNVRSILQCTFRRVNQVISSFSLCSFRPVGTSPHSHTCYK